MYFRNYGLRKTQLHKRLKSPVLDDPLTGNVVNGQKTASMSTAAPLPYSLITVKVIGWERFPLSGIENLKN